MADFPRTQIEDLSLSRLIMGTNWFLGFSHTSKAQDDMINRRMDAKAIADVLQVFLREGVDTLLGFRPEPKLMDAVKQAEDRVGRKIIRIGTPHLDLAGTPAAEAANAKGFDTYADIGVSICMPHQAATDALVDRRSRSIPGMERYCAMIRERGMIPGLSTHMPETPGYADASGLDVATYIQIYNPIGFLMQVEIDWVHRVIQKAKRPVITIKPLAAGRVLPLVGMAFVWNTIREQDMVCIGCFTPDEAREIIDLSRGFLERRALTPDLQRSRSKESILV